MIVSGRHPCIHVALTVGTDLLHNLTLRKDLICLASGFSSMGDLARTCANNPINALFKADMPQPVQDTAA